MYLVDIHLYYAPVAGESIESLRSRINDAVLWGQHFVETQVAWRTSEDCFVAMCQSHLCPRVDLLDKTFSRLAIEDLSAVDVYSSISLFLETADFIEEVCAAEGGDDLERVEPDVVLARVPADLRSAFSGCLRRVGNTEWGADPEAGRETLALASTSCSASEIEIRLRGREGSWLPWESPPRPETSGLDEIVQGFEEFEGTVRRCYEYLIPVDDRSRLSLCPFTVLPEFVESIHETGTDQDLVRLKRVVRRATLFLCGQERYDAHVIRGRKREDGAELWHFYLNLGRVGWRLQFFSRTDGVIDLFRVVSHDVATR